MVKVEAVKPPFSQYNSALLSWYEQFDEPILAISVTSSKNLLKLSDTHALTLLAEVSACPFQERSGLRHSVYFYIEGMEAGRFVSENRKTKEARVAIDAYDSSASNKTYDILVLPKYDSSRLARPETDAQGPLIRIYDLRSHPQDICLRLRGYGMLWYGFESEVLTVPKERIIEALQHPVAE